VRPRLKHCGFARIPGRTQHETGAETAVALFVPGRLRQEVTNLLSCFGESINNLEVECRDGEYYLRPFQSYTGVKGKASDGTILEPWGKNQQAVQMDNDALAIMEDRPVRVPGEEGLRDIVVVEKIFESAAKGGEWLEIPAG
jgi:glucose-fructose oxidoreductase